MEVTDILKGLADETRIRILNILHTGEYCVCDIESILKLTQSNASRHLNKLKSLKIINAKKKSQWVYYSLNKDLITKYGFIKQLIREIDNDDILKEDLTIKEEYLKNKYKCAI